ncbi:hypothetical protein [Cereibacter azotoformans]|uniref:Uncharacterized protein n=1 Tax=Cereibacter azotoformans TaxID=43057 RepID=A0A2T5JSQ7_9RHOB|nr:hypothetical protein [Cereibacter azotoformans]PTR11637.1 hypothetical protein C8J28_12629 [Cereibacter azotoformans]
MQLLPVFPSPEGLIPANLRITYSSVWRVIAIDGRGHMSVHTAVAPFSRRGCEEFFQNHLEQNGQTFICAKSTPLIDVPTCAQRPEEARARITALIDSLEASGVLCDPLLRNLPAGWVKPFEIFVRDLLRLRQTVSFEVALVPQAVLFDGNVLLVFGDPEVRDFVRAMWEWLMAQTRMRCILTGEAATQLPSGQAVGRAGEKLLKRDPAAFNAQVYGSEAP